MLRTIIFAIALLCFSIPTTAIAENTLLKAVQKKYSSLSSFSVDFSQVLYNSDSKEKETRSGIFSFKKPMLILWKTVKPAEEYIIVSKKEIWNYIPVDKVAFQYPLSMMNDVAIFIYILSGQSNISQNFTVKELRKTSETSTFLLTPIVENPSVINLELTINKKTSEITQVKITDFYYNTNTISLLNFKENAMLNDADFVFVPPVGVSIIDNSADIIDE